MSSDEIESDAVVLERRKLARKMVPYLMDLLKPTVRTEIWKSAFCIGVVVFAFIFGISRLDMINLSAKIDKLSAEVKAIPAAPMNQTQTINQERPPVREDTIQKIITHQFKGAVE